MSTQSEKLYKEQLKTYEGFLRLVKYACIAGAIVLILMYFFLVA